MLKHPYILNLNSYLTYLLVFNMYSILLCAVFVLKLNKIYFLIRHIFILWRLKLWFYYKTFLRLIKNFNFTIRLKKNLIKNKDSSFLKSTHVYLILIPAIMVHMYFILLHSTLSYEIFKYDTTETDFTYWGASILKHENYEFLI